MQCWWTYDFSETDWGLTDWLTGLIIVWRPITWLFLVMTSRLYCPWKSLTAVTSIIMQRFWGLRYVRPNRDGEAYFMEGGLGQKCNWIEFHAIGQLTPCHWILRRPIGLHTSCHWIGLHFIGSYIILSDHIFHVIGLDFMSLDKKCHLIRPAAFWKSLFPGVRL